MDSREITIMVILRISKQIKTYTPRWIEDPKIRYPKKNFLIE